jgi:hypothetical protein
VAQLVPAALLVGAGQAPPAQAPAVLHWLVVKQTTPAQGLAGTGVGAGVNVGAGVEVVTGGKEGSAGGGGPPATTTLTARPGKAAATDALIKAVARVQSSSVFSTPCTSASTAATAAASALAPTSNVSVKVTSEPPPPPLWASRRRVAPPLGATLVTAQLASPPVKPRRSSSSAQKAACCAASKSSGATPSTVKLRVTSGAGGAGDAGGAGRGDRGGASTEDDTRTKRHAGAPARGAASAAAVQPRAGSSRCGAQPLSLVSRKYAPGRSGAGIAAQRS